MSVDDLETDFLGRCQPPAKIGADQKAGDLISQVRIFINFCRIGIVFETSEIGVLFTDKSRYGRSDPESDTETIDRRGHIVELSGGIAPVQMLQPFVIDPVGDVTTDFQTQIIYPKSRFFGRLDKAV